MPLRRASSMLTVLLMAPVSSCGGGPSAQVQTGPSSADTDHAEAQARGDLEALDAIAATQVCITPELCEDLRAWRPDRLDMLDGHLVAMGGEHAFVRVDGAWVHYAIPFHGEPMSNGHAAFFCDRDGGVFELTTEGVRRRGTLPSTECAAVVVAGAQLYVVVGDGPILRQNGEAWVPLEMQLAYGNGYSVNTVVMTPTRAFLVDEEARLLELPATGPSYEPVLAVETGLGHMTTLRAVPGRETIFAIDRALAIIEDGTVRHVPLPRRGLSPETSTSNDAEDSAQGEEDAYEEEGGVREISETEFEMGMWVVGLDPLIVARGYVAMVPHTAGGSLTIDYFVLEPAGWSPRLPQSPESFLFGVAPGAFATNMPDRSAPIHIGPYRAVVNAYHDGARGPSVTAWRHDGVDVALTAFAPQRGVAPESGCDREGVECTPSQGGGIARLVSGATPTLELLSEDGTEVFLRHEVDADLRVLDVSGRERVYVRRGDGSVGYIDAEGLHPIARPAAASVRELHAGSNGTAYLVGGDGHVSYFDGASLTLMPHADVLTSEHAWYPLADGFVVPVVGQQPLWMRGLELRSLAFGAIAPDLARRVPTGEIVLAARDGHSWIVRGADVFEVTAPVPDAAHAGGLVYYLPEDTLDGMWRVTFAHPYASGPGYRASAPAVRRSLGELASLARAYRAPLVALNRSAFNPFDERARGRDAVRGTTAPATLAFWEAGDEEADPPFTWAGSAILADASMEHVVFATQPAFGTQPRTGPSVVARFVAMHEATPSDAPAEGETASFARSLADSPGMTEARAFRLGDGPLDHSELLGVVPTGPRADEILRVRIERGRTVIVEVIDRANTRATQVGRLSVPARSTLTFGVASVSEDGQRVALALGVAPANDDDGTRARAHHLVLPLPAALSRE